MNATLLLTNGDRELWMDDGQYFGTLASQSGPAAPEPRTFANYYDAAEWLQDAKSTTKAPPVLLPGWLRRQG